MYTRTDPTQRPATSVEINVEQEEYDRTSNNWSHPNNNKMFQEKFGSHTRKKLIRFTTKDGYTWNVTHNKGNTAVWKLKPKQWRSLLIQDMQHQGEKSWDKRQQNDDDGEDLCQQSDETVDIISSCPIMA